jgi:hypothetical protein
VNGEPRQPCVWAGRPNSRVKRPGRFTGDHQISAPDPTSGSNYRRLDCGPGERGRRWIAGERGRSGRRSACGLAGAHRFPARVLPRASPRVALWTRVSRLAGVREAVAAAAAPRAALRHADPDRTAERRLVPRRERVADRGEESGHARKRLVRTPSDDLGDPGAAPRAATDTRRQDHAPGLAALYTRKPGSTGVCGRRRFPSSHA